MDQPGWHPLNYAATGHRWLCPHTGLSVPKRLKENVRARIELLERAETSASLRRQLLAASARSFLFWCNLFVWTYKPLEIGPAPDFNDQPAAEAEVPWVTWPCQDAADVVLEETLDKGGDLDIDKSRAMGASWLVLAKFLHRATFRKRMSYKVISRKEDEVDDPGNPDCLMWKIDFARDRLPWWMIPRFRRTSMHYEDLDTGSVIDGESTNDDVGRGGRRHAIMVDEAAAIDKLRQILMATHKGVSARIFVSTPKGPGAYYDLRFGGKARVFVLGFWDHPEMGRGRFLKDEDRRRLPSSPYREAQLRLKSKREVAQNLDIDHMTAGAMFFDPADLNRALAMAQTRKPITGSLRIAKTVDLKAADVVRRRLVHRLVWRNDPGGLIKLWCQLELDEQGLMRPPQDRTYVLGMDICWGLGGDNRSSNSVIWGLERDTGNQVLEFATPHMEPGALTLLACGLGLWMGGRRGCALLGWEANGPGQTVTKHARRLSYPWKYRRVAGGRTVERASDQLGWYSNEETKEQALGELRSAMAMDKMRVWSVDTIRELGQYVYLESGRIAPAGHAEAEGDAKATHGDRVIAAAVARVASLRAGLSPIEEPKAPPGTVADELGNLDEESDEEYAGR